MSSEKKTNKITVQNGFEFDENGHLVTRDSDLHIVVDGSFFSGKSTFIRTITQDCLYEERGASIENLTDDYDATSDENADTFFNLLSQIRINLFLGIGRIIIDPNVALYLHEPYQPIYEFWEEIEQVNLLGMIVLLKGDDPQHFREATSKLGRAEMYRLPCIVVSNSYKYGYNPETQQMSAATEGWAIEDLQIALRLNEDITIMSCDVTSKESVKNVLLNLLYQVLDEIETAENH